MKKILLICAAMFIFCGCWSPNYSKIPLQQNDIPYILADGDYMDNQGALHKNQHNVWALSQADVYDYMTYVRRIGETKSTVQEIASIPSKITKTHIILAISILFDVLLLILIIKRRKHKED
jgi:hypothetical protein